MFLRLRFDFIRHIGLAWVCIFLAFFPGVQANAQFFARYSVANGLPNNNVNQIFKDRDGYVWICTSNGLSRYDGFDFVNFLSNPADSNSLPNNDVQSICQDETGRLWIGMKGGLAIYFPKKGIFRSVHIPFDRGFDKISHIFCDSRNRIWITSWVGSYLVSSQGKLVKHWKKGNRTGDLHHDHTHFTFEDSRRQIWVSGHGGLSRFDEKTMGWITFPVAVSLLPNGGWQHDIQGIREDEKGIFWTGSWANGLRRFDPKTGQYETFLTTPEFAGEGAFNVITDVACFDGKIWVASHDRGLGYFNPAEKKFRFHKDMNLEGFTLPTNKTTCLLADGPILWAGGEYGLYKFDMRKQLFEVHRLAGLQSGSCLPDISDACLWLASDSSLFISTWTCGLFSYQLKKRIVKQVFDPVRPASEDGLNVEIKQLRFWADSTLWMSTSHALYRMQGRHFEDFRPKPEINRLTGWNYFFETCQDKPGHIWVGSARGIYQFSKKGLMPIHYPKGKVAPRLKDSISDQILSVSKAPNGDVWFLRGMGGEGGKIAFTVYRLAMRRFETYSTRVGLFSRYPLKQTATRLLVASDGRVFVSSERGIVAFDGANPSTFRVFASHDGLLADVSYDMVEDRLGHLWISTDFGLSCLTLKTNHIQTFTSEDGLPDARITSLSLLADGRIAVGCHKEWFALLYPERLHVQNRSSHPLRFTSVFAGEKKFLPQDSLVLESSVQVARLTFSPFNFLPASDNHFRISIAHKSAVSTYESKRNEAIVSDLSPGWYTISVTDKEERTSLIHLYKEPYFWQTRWFLFLCIVTGFSCFTLGLLWYQRRRIAARQQAREIEIQLAEQQMTALRSQIDAHFIFNALNAINSLIWQKLPEKASNLLSQFARLMRLTLEHTRSPWIPLSEEMEALQSYIALESIRLPHPPSVRFEVAENLDPQETDIPPMLLQPLVENAFLHAFGLMEASGNLLIKIARMEERLQIEVVDNGPGHLGQQQIQAKQHRSLASRIIVERLDLLTRQTGVFCRYEQFRDEETGHTISRLILPFREKF